VRRRLGILLGVLFLTLGIGGVTAGPAAAAQHQNANIYVFWNFAGANGFWNVDQQVRVAQKAHHSYWAMVWGYTSTPNEGGYMGLQTDGIRGGQTIGDMAIFSLWNANASRGGNCAAFSGEGNGLSCRLAYPISTSVYYRYRVWRLEADAGGQWWGAWIQNTATGVDTHLGSLRVAASKNLTTTPYNFSEYWGTQVSCDAVPVSVAYFTQPAANQVSAGTYQYGSTYASGSRASCTGGGIQVVSVGTTKAAKVTLGGPR